MFYNRKHCLNTRPCCETHLWQCRSGGGRARSQLHPASWVHLCRAGCSAAVLHLFPTCPDHAGVISENGRARHVLPLLSISGHIEISLGWGVLSTTGGWMGVEPGWTTASHYLVGENGRKWEEWEKMRMGESERKLVSSRAILINIKEKHQQQQMEIWQKWKVFIQEVKFSGSSEKH